MAAGRKTGGRHAGTPNKITADVKAIAAEYTEEALEVLAIIMRNRKSPAQARVAAAKELLDRAHGKPFQSIGGEEGRPIETRVTFGGRYKPQP